MQSQEISETRESEQEYLFITFLWKRDDSIIKDLRLPEDEIFDLDALIRGLFVEGIQDGWIDACEYSGHVDFGTELQIRLNRH